MRSKENLISLNVIKRLEKKSLDVQEKRGSYNNKALVASSEWKDLPNSLVQLPNKTTQIFEPRRNSFWALIKPGDWLKKHLHAFSMLISTSFSAPFPYNKH